MDSLFLKHDRYYAETSTEIIRECINDIDWDARLISIQGPKGVGKSTLIRQFIRLNYPQHSRKVLGSVSSSVSGAGPSDSLDMQI